MGNKELSEGLECICRLRTSGKIVSENTGGDKPSVRFDPGQSSHVVLTGQGFLGTRGQGGSVGSRCHIVDDELHTVCTGLNLLLLHPP